MVVHAILGAFLCLLTFRSVGVFGSALESRVLTIDDIPPCGLTCLFLTVPKSGCAFSDFDCQCQNDGFRHTSAACLLANCTMAETLDTSKVQADLCGLPKESKASDVYIYTITVFAIAGLFVTLRIIGKIATKRIAMDDWIMIAAFAILVAPVACVLKMAGIGFGEHLWNLQDGQLLQNLRLFYFAWSIYTVSLGLIKVSLCLFYIEIFPMPRIRMVCYGILTWITVNTSVILFLTIFSCIPVQAFWNRDIDGKCLDINALAYANSASAIAQDVVLVVFPLSCVRTLNMKRYRKIAVGFMFCVGTFGCITTLIRLHTLLSFKTTIDPTWDYVPITIWTELELASGFICASLPAVRILFVRIIPKSVHTLVTTKMKSRSRSAQTPGLYSSNARKSDRKRLSWMHISTNDDYTTDSETQYRASTLWPGSSPKTDSRSRSHQRPGSLSGNKEFDISHLRTFTTPFPLKPASEEEDQVLEMHTVAKSRQQRICYSCGHENEVILALPNIGCLPEEGFATDDSVDGDIRWWDQVRRSVEQSRCGLGK